MNLDNVRKFFNLLLTAIGIFVIIFILYSIVIASRLAQDKKKHEIEKGYAGERVTPSVTITP